MPDPKLYRVRGHRHHTEVHHGEPLVGPPCPLGEEPVWARQVGARFHPSNHEHLGMGVGREVPKG